jgi:hypothetical protein
MPRVMGSGYWLSCAETEERRERMKAVVASLVLESSIVECTGLLIWAGRGKMANLSSVMKR